MKFEYSHEVQLRHARNDGRGYNTVVSYNCKICGHNRGSKLHTDKCSRKIKELTKS
jgi:hypothetical protein